MFIDNDFIIELRKKLKVSQSNLASMLGVSQTTIAFIENRQRAVPKSVMLAVMNLPQKYKFDSEIMELYNKNNLNCIVNSNSVPIPFYSVKASAGYGETLPDYQEKDIIYFDRRWLKNVLGVNPDNVAIIQAKGDSMDGGNNPIKDGDLLMVDCSVKEGNNVFVIKDDNELRVKKLKWNFDGTLDIISNNPKYSVETLDENTGYFRNIEIIGKVVWNGSKENV